MESAHDLLVEAPPNWTPLEVRILTPSPTRDATSKVGPDRARLALAGGAVEIERAPSRATFRLDEPPPVGHLVHPLLASVAAVAARWAGRESFHAGAVLAGGGAWAVLGEKGNGKSTTLASLALEGHEVLADDLLVVDGANVLAGPRCLDLREQSAARLGAGEALGRVGARERWRLPLAPVAPSAPLRGFVVLDWHDEVSVQRMRGPERLLAIMPHRSVRLTPEDPERLLDLSSLPIWRVRRPHRWDVLGETVERLVAAIAG